MTIDKYDIDWTPVEKALNEGTFSGYKIAVVETEKLLHHALREQNIPGRSTNQQLKAAATFLSRPEDLQHARMVHEKIMTDPGFDISREDTKVVIAHYYHAIADLMTLQPHHLSRWERVGFFLQRILPWPLMRTVALWVVVGLAGILFFSETETGRTAARAIADGAQWLLLFVVIPAAAVLLIIKIIQRFGRSSPRRS